MLPTLKSILTGLIFLAATIALALLADAWHSARQDSQQLAATLAAQKTVIEQAAEREKLRDSQLSQALASIQAKKRSIRTPQEAAAQLGSVLPPLPLPLSILPPNLSVPAPAGEPPATTITVPQPDLIPLYNAMQDCSATALQTATLQKDLADEKSRSSAFQRERDAAVASAHGGPWLVRIKRAAKWLALGIATGALAATAAAHR